MYKLLYMQLLAYLRLRVTTADNYMFSLISGLLKTIDAAIEIQL